MSEAKQIYHVPVLLKESVDGMNIQPGRHVCRRDLSAAEDIPRKFFAGWIARRTAAELRPRRRCRDATL